jgi:hypothetical protein
VVESKQDSMVDDLRCVFCVCVVCVCACECAYTYICVCMCGLYEKVRAGFPIRTLADASLVSIA